MKLILLFLFLATLAKAVTFSWNANPESDISYYRLYVGTNSGVYVNSYLAIGGATTNFGVANSLFVTGRTNFAALTAINTAGLESAKSLEISFVITNSSPSTPNGLRFISQ